MICVSIGRTRHKMVIAEHKNLAEKGAELVEYRLDWLGRDPDLTQLLKDRPTPVVATCRRAVDCGKWRGSEEQRMSILRAAIVAGVDYVDLEDDVAPTVPRFGPTKRIVSHHNFTETPDNIEDIYARMCEMDPDIVKIVTMANHPLDMVRMMKLVQSSAVPTVGFCMGEFGLASRVLCGKYGSPFTYASFSSERELAPGQISFDEMKNIYHFDDLNAETRIFAVIGDPIGHSLSPLVHNTAFQEEGLNNVYVPFRIPPESLIDTLRAFGWFPIDGYSVTIPHKEKVLELVDFPEEIAQEIGAANTLTRDKSGRWRASNTDYEAALGTIRKGLKSAGHTDSNLNGKSVLILGAGGVTRAIALGLLKAGCSVTICNRTAKRADELAQELNCRSCTWENRGSVHADILINGTPIGMHPNVNESPFESYWFRDGMLVFDTIYNPENTLLLKEAREHHCRTASGLEMFVQQAALQYERFTNQPAPHESMIRALRHGMSPLN